MKNSFFLFLLIASACGVKHSSIHYGKTTAAQLVKESGGPIQKESPAKNTQIYHYAENENFQIKDNIATHGFKNPKGDELSLLYWKHKFKNCETESKKIDAINGHVLPEFELKCSSLGLTVIYSEGSEFVSRVIEHEKK